jgi:hypothetical protein
VNVWVAELPMLTLPNATAVVGVTAMSTWATLLATAEHPLSLPAVSTAVTATLYVAVVVKPVRRKLTV